MNEAKPTPRRWVGVVLSLLIPGAGLFLAGKRKEGTYWFLTIITLSLVAIFLASLAAIPGLMAFAVLSAITLGITVWMLVRSYKPVPRLGLRGWLLFLLLMAAVGQAENALMHRLTRPFKLPTGSMEPTIRRGDHLMAQTSAYWFSPPRRGDVVVFRTEQWDAWHIPEGQFFVKRVAGLPGETLQIKQGRLILEDHPIDRPAALANSKFEMPGIVFPRSADTYVIPAGRYFVVGDNTTNSLDSRYFGSISRASIVGKATKIYWPFAHAGDIQ